MTEVSADAPAHLVAYLAEHGIAAEFVRPGIPMPTVATAAAAIGVTEGQILKTLLFVDDCGEYVVAIASGPQRIDRIRLATVTGRGRLRVAAPAAVLAVTGYSAGGVAPLGLKQGLPVVVDAAVMAADFVYGGGGREDLLLRVKPADVVRLNRAVVATIVERV